MVVFLPAGRLGRQMAISLPCPTLGGHSHCLRRRICCHAAYLKATPLEQRLRAISGTSAISLLVQGSLTCVSEVALPPFQKEMHHWPAVFDQLRGMFRSTLTRTPLTLCTVNDDETITWTANRVMQSRRPFTSTKRPPLSTICREKFAMSTPRSKQ